jgi:hypothetical protein
MGDNNLLGSQLELVLLKAGISYPAVHSQNWKLFLDQKLPIPVNDLELDNLTLNELCSQLNIQFEVRISPQQISEMDTLEDLRKFLESHLRDSQLNKSQIFRARKKIRMGMRSGSQYSLPIVQEGRPSPLPKTLVVLSPGEYEINPNKNYQPKK